MAFQYVITFSILVTEMIFFSLISLPLPSKIRRPLLKALSIPFNNNNFQIVLKCVFAFIGIMFVDSVNRTMKVNIELSNLDQNISFNSNRLEIQSRRFYSQRNMYLCGFTLFLSLILNRTYSMVFELLSVKEEIQKINSESNSTEKSTSKTTGSSAKIEKLKKEKESILLKSKALADEYSS
jgi:B-cell receptor-associated protein 31